MKSIFICPVCGESLRREEKRYICPAGHSFDLASEGYVHLLPANRMHSKLPGDDKAMVAARNAFLSTGGYAMLARALCELSEKHTPAGGALLDSGCGEGYYTSAIARRLGAKNASVAGIDISKAAVRLAAKRERGAEFAVASAYHLPLADNCADVVVSCFSPLCPEEFFRVLHPGGRFIYVVPGPRHLWQLKAAVYDTPYENERKTDSYDGFEHETCHFAEDKILLKDRESIENLFTMTPYFWKTPPEGWQRLRSLESLETEISFDIHIYKKL